LLLHANQIGVANRMDLPGKRPKVGEPQNLPKGRGFVFLLASFFGLTAGLCTVFALVVTTAQAWQDHVHAQWPEATAQVQRCGLDIYTHKPESYRIDCTVSYTVSGDEVVSHVYSHSTPAPRRVIWQYPPQQFEMLQAWVDAHPKGTAIAVHYDPASHTKAVLVVTDMPLGGSPTPSNLRLLGVAAASCVVLLAIARAMRPRSVAVNEGG
jgi:Protein of unknown function (DUF3592)